MKEMDKERSLYIWGAALIILIAVCSVFGYKSLRHEKNQNIDEEKVSEFDSSARADEEKDNAKKRACGNCGVTFVDLSEIQSASGYRAGMGTTVYDAAGNAHKIEHEGVAGHPGDKGMGWIAAKILKELK